MCVCRTVVLPCASFCEAAREGCEPVLQMFNASWPDFLRCSQFSNTTSALSPPSSPSSPSPTGLLTSPACYTPRQIKGKPCEYKPHIKSFTQKLELRPQGPPVGKMSQSANVLAQIMSLKHSKGSKLNPESRSGTPVSSYHPPDP